jgi:hypothetical protein
MRRLLLLPLVALGCAPALPPPEPSTEIPPAALASSPPLPLPSASASAPAPPEPGGEELDCSEGLFQEKIAGLQRATAARQRDAIYKALDGVFEVRPRALEQRELLARMLHEDGKTAEAGEAGLVLVELREGKSALGWLLAGLAAEAGGDREKARAAFARSAAMDPSGEAARRLGKASRCPAEARAPGRQDRITLVQGWRGVFGEINPTRMVKEEAPDPTSEAEARRRACIHNDLSEITGRDVCKGKGPWVVQTGHMHFHDHNTIILPLPAGRFALFAYFTGGGCRGGEQASLELRGDVIEVSEQIVGIAADASLCDDGPRDAMSGACIASTEQRTTFHDAGTGKALLVLSEREPGERFSIQGTKLRRSGVAGCDETVDLRRLPPHLKPHP